MTTAKRNTLQLCQIGGTIDRVNETLRHLTSSIKSRDELYGSMDGILFSG
jgi:hypothetical protein